jgi:hypothetical protein
MHPQSKKSQTIQIQCQYCQNDDASLMEPVTILRWYCSVCARVFEIGELYDSTRTSTMGTETEVPKTNSEENR